MPERPSSAGARAGVGNCQGVETPRPLVSAQKGAQKTTNYQKTPRDWESQERLKRKNGGGRQEARNWRQDPPRDRQRPGCRLIPEGKGSGLSKCRGMDRTKKGVPTGVNRDVSGVEGGNGGQTDGGRCGRSITQRGAAGVDR